MKYTISHITCRLLLLLSVVFAINANATLIDPRTDNTNTIVSVQTVDNYYWWTPGSSLTNLAGLYLNVNPFSNLSSGDFSNDWFLTPTADNVLIKFLPQGQSSTSAYLSFNAYNASSSHYINFTMGYNDEILNGYNGGFGELQLFNFNDILLETVTIEGKMDTQGRQFVENGNYVASWFMDSNGYLGDTHLKTSVPEPSVILLFSLGLFGLAVRKKRITII